jgi:hypothetical protein
VGEGANKHPCKLTGQRDKIFMFFSKIGCKERNCLVLLFDKLEDFSTASHASLFKYTGHRGTLHVCMFSKSSALYKLHFLIVHKIRGCAFVYIFSDPLDVIRGLSFSPEDIGL